MRAAVDPQQRKAAKTVGRKKWIAKPHIEQSGQNVHASSKPPSKSKNREQLGIACVGLANHEAVGLILHESASNIGCDL